jgi:hypothetical protein
MALNENERWWQAYLAALAGSYACEDQDSLPASAAGDAIRAANMAVEDYREHCGNNSSASEPDWTGHARVELLGHRSYLGRIREVERYGAHMGEVQELLASGEYGDVHTFGGKAIHTLTPVTLEEALRELRPIRYPTCAAKGCWESVKLAWGQPGYDDPIDVYCEKCKAEGKDKAEGKAEGESQGEAELPFDGESTEAAE